jgi:hypothetical protein
MRQRSYKGAGAERQGDKATGGDRGWKRHYPLLLLVGLQVFGTFYCVMDLQRRHHLQAEQDAFLPTSGDVSYDAGDRQLQERCLFLVSFLPNTCGGYATGMVMP